MHFTLQQIRLFEAVTRLGSVTRAAEALHLTQPAVSIQIKRLESQVGLSLFEHVGRRIYPTRAGKAVYAASRDILDRVGALKDEVAEMQGEISGPLSLAVVTTTKYFMPNLIGEFLDLYPTVEPRLYFSNRARILERLADNRDDLVVMGQVPGDDKLVAHPFLDNVLVCVAPSGHPLVGEKTVSVARLVQERFLVREEGSGTRMAVDRYIADSGCSIDPYMELGSSEAIKQGVVAGLGIAILSRHSIALELQSGLLSVLHVEGFPLVRPWFAVYHGGKRLSLVARTFLDHILERRRENA